MPNCRTHGLSGSPPETYVPFFFPISEWSAAPPQGIPHRSTYVPPSCHPNMYTRLHDAFRCPSFLFSLPLSCPFPYPNVPIQASIPYYASPLPNAAKHRQSCRICFSCRHCGRPLITGPPEGTCPLTQSGPRLWENEPCCLQTAPSFETEELFLFKNSTP
ncbi:hypothetical protein CEXT_775751 [Caerostris extrusa]|uniref:Uncharacterized protein n=1 Tax=Caerostris extrusa TaxID=172846 RepID=A0AAV4QB00_CAEEX|nr:hypothetical protein CEXT_775751 [Caerostris extrusa]